MNTITEPALLEEMKQNGALTVLFGGRQCSVCHSIRPNLSSMLKTNFPEMRSVYVDCEESPEICAQHNVFSLPAVKVYIEGMLITEEARVFSLAALMQRIKRPYTIWLDSRE